MGARGAARRRGFGFKERFCHFGFLCGVDVRVLFIFFKVMFFSFLCSTAVAFLLLEY